MGEALLEYTVFGERITVSEEDGVYRARLSADPERIWGKGNAPLTALGDCVLRWSTLEAGAGPRAGADHAGSERGDNVEAEDGGRSERGRTRAYPSTQVRLTVPAARSTSSRRKTARREAESAPADHDPEEHVVFGQRVLVARHGRDNFVAQLEGRLRMWWGHGATAQEALADCVLNWSSPLARIPDGLLSAQAEFELLGQPLIVCKDGDGFSAHLDGGPAIRGRGATVREALGSCMVCWGKAPGEAGIPQPRDVPEGRPALAH